MKYERLVDFIVNLVFGSYLEMRGRFAELATAYGDTLELSDYSIIFKDFEQAQLLKTQLEHLARLEPYSY